MNMIMNSKEACLLCDVVQVLGVTIHSDLWHNQVDHMLTSANKKHFVLRQLKKCGV